MPGLTAEPAPEIRDEATLFAALGDETRLRLVVRLGVGVASIIGLTRGGGLTRQAVTKHLYVLEKAGLVRHSRSGRETVWALDRDRFDQARHYLGTISRQWDEALERLRLFVEE